MPIKVNGGIITDQMLSGTLRYFKMTGAFNWTVSDGTVTLDADVAGGDPATSTFFTVGDGRPVAGSLADWALRAISERCTIVEIGVVGAPGAESAIHFATGDQSFGWITDPGVGEGAGDGLTDISAMQNAVAAIGATLTVPITAGAAGASPVTATPSTTVVITEVPFELA